MTRYKTRYTVLASLDQFEELYFCVYDRRRKVVLGFKGSRTECWAEATRLENL